MDNGIMLMSGVPELCPECGRRFFDGDNAEMRRMAIQDWWAGCWHTCSCGLRFRHVKEATLAKIAPEDGHEY